jgi:hypothetical protein
VVFLISVCAKVDGNESQKHQRREIFKEKWNNNVFKSVLIEKSFVFLEGKSRRKFNRKNSKKISTNDEKNFFVHCCEQASLVASKCFSYLTNLSETKLKCLNVNNLLNLTTLRTLASFLASLLASILASL